MGTGSTAQHCYSFMLHWLQGDYDDLIQSAVTLFDIERAETEGQHGNIKVKLSTSAGEESSTSTWREGSASGGQSIGPD